MAQNSATPAPSMQNKTVYVSRDGTAMRNGPGPEYEVTGTFESGDSGICLSEQGDWIQVHIQQQTGYILQENLSDARPWPAMPDAFENPRMVVKKAERILYLCDGQRVYAAYPVALGWAPEGDKQQEGDGKTPEGSYAVCSRNGNSRYHRSLGLSYPNADDAARGLEAGLIDQDSYQRILSALGASGWPPWNTALGGAIMIHGGGSGGDWTAGCIALDNENMDVIWRMCPVGTQVEILP